MKYRTAFKQYIFPKFEQVMMGKSTLPTVVAQNLKEVVSSWTVQQYFNKYSSDSINNYYELQGPSDSSFEDYQVLA